MDLYINPKNVSWKVKPTSDELSTYTIINYGGVRNSAYTGLYDVNQAGLVIKNATINGKPISTAGLYIGQCANNPNKTGVKLLVVRSGPVCSCVPLNYASNVSCNLTYADSSYHPILPIVTWKLNGVFLASYTLQRTKITPELFFSQSTITRTGGSLDDYTCELTFAPPTDIQFPYIATNAPEFNESCSTEACPITTTGQPTTLTTTTPVTTMTSQSPNNECLPNLKNIAVYEGDKNILLNVTAEPHNVKWMSISTSNEFDSNDISDYSDQVNSQYDGVFYLNRSGLVILDAKTEPDSTSGLFIAQCADNDNRTAAKFIVVRKAPYCSCNASVPDAVQLTCTLEYADFTLNPINANMTWSTDGVFYTSDTPPRTRNDTVFVSTSTIIVDNSVPANFTCTVTFNAPTDVEYDFIATNAPEFSASCSVDVCGLITTTSITTVTSTETMQPTTTLPSFSTTQLPFSTTQKLSTTLPLTTATQLPFSTTQNPSTTLPLTTATLQPFSTTQNPSTTLPLTTSTLQTATLTEILTSTVPSTTTPSYCSSNMKNIAVREGTLNVPMNLTSSPCAVTLTVIPTSNEFSPTPITGSDCNVDPTLADLYYLNRTELTIRNSTATDVGQPISTAGLYIADCYNDQNYRTGAKLLVVHSGPDCSCLPDSSSSNIDLTCTVTFADGTVNPIPAIITWIINGEVYTTDTPERNKTDTYVFTATSTITVVGSLVSSYQCILTFGAPANESQYDWIATNAPEFNESCSTPVCSATTTNSQTMTKAPSISSTSEISPTTASNTTQIVTTTSFPTTVSSYCLPNLKNIAVREGTLDVSMNVSASPCAVTLSVKPTSDELSGKQIVGPGCASDSTIANLYYVNRTSLIIRNSTTTENGNPISTAGLYIAECYNSGNYTGAKLVVVRSGPVCSCTPDDSSSSVTLSCSVVAADYTSNPIPAIMTWIVNGNNYTTDEPYQNKTDLTTYTATSTITVDGNTLNSYQCILTFGEPTEKTYDWVATNAPEFTDSCSTPVCSAMSSQLPTSPTTTTSAETTAPATNAASATISLETTTAPQATEILPSTTVIGQCMTKPQNIALLERTTNTLVYYPSNPNSVKFTNTATTDELTEAVLVNYDDTVDPYYAADYAFDPSSGLTIKTATILSDPANQHQLSTSGLYNVECDHGDPYSFKVLVVRAVSCSKPSSNQVTCNCVYADSTYDPIAAILTLYEDGNPTMSQTPERTMNDDGYTFVSSYTFTPNSSTATYKCGVTFGQPTEVQASNVALNGPTYDQPPSPC